MTPTQIRILELRAQGLTQSRISEILGTTRANVCITEKRGMKNVMKARNTLGIYEKVIALGRIELAPGTDVFDAPKKVFDFATKYEIKVKENSISLVEKIQKQVNRKLKGRKIIEPLEITILKDGYVIID